MVQYRRSTPRMEEGTMTNKQTLVGCEAPSTPWQPSMTRHAPATRSGSSTTWCPSPARSRGPRCWRSAASPLRPQYRWPAEATTSCVELGDNLATIARGKLQSLFVGENETNGSHPLYGVGCRPRSTLGPPGRPDAAYAQTTWNDVLGSSRSPAPLHLLRAACADPSPASAPAGYVELAAVSLDYATPLLFVDQPRHGREESLPGALVEGPVAREAA